MRQFGWDTCPAAVRAQVGSVVSAMQTILGDTLVGIYLHGSLAFGCFNPSRSDIDLLVVTTANMPLSTKQMLVALFLARSGQPSPIEISCFRQDDLRPWRYPPPFDLHYSEDWRSRYARDLAAGTWVHWNDAPQVDPDLGAHVAVTLARGICLTGAPIPAVFPREAIHDYRAAILHDFADWPTYIALNPVYYILNACRIAAYLADGAIRSKAEGGAWALSHLPQEWHSLIAAALAAYQGDGEDGGCDSATEQRFAAYMTGLIQAYE